jgi:hypothetical protein
MAVRSLSCSRAHTPKNASLRTRGSQDAGAQTPPPGAPAAFIPPLHLRNALFIPTFHGLLTCQHCWQAPAGAWSCLPQPLRMTSILLTHHHATLPLVYPLAPNLLCLGLSLCGVSFWGVPDLPRHDTLDRCAAAI